MSTVTEHANKKESVAASELVTGDRIGRFIISSRLGKGGMGEVYQAQDSRLKRTVALKRLSAHLRADPLYRRRFEEEAERASRLNDSHIAAVHDVLEERGETFLVLEFVEGATLRERLKQPMSLEQFFSIADQCLQALVVAHAQGVLHCDIKPENIMLSSDGQVKILDFGVARRFTRSDQSTTIDRPGTIYGTLAYMAPEVLLEKPADARTDIFSLGVVFYELLTGENPFIADSFVETSDRIRGETPAPIRITNSEVPENLEKLVNRAMAKDPAQRYCSVHEMLCDLRVVEGDVTASGLARLLPRKQEPKSKGRVVLATLAGLLAIALFAGLYFKSKPMNRLSGRPTPVQLAVLPFTASSDDPNTQALCNGLTETLAVKLTQLTGAYPLQVVPTSEVRAEGISNAEQARKGFGVNLVLEGSLQESGHRARIVYSLVDAATLRQISAETITADTSDAFGLQDRVVESVVTMLGLQLRGNDRQNLVAHGTQEPAAHDYYLRGLGYLQEYQHPENIESAIALFSRALERDPKYALAHAGMGQAYWLKYDATYEADWLERAGQACEHAVALDSESAPGHTCLGTVDVSRGRYEEAARQFQRATKSDPTSEGAYRGLASAYERMGKLAEAEKTYRTAIQVWPQYWAGYGWLGSFYSRQARYAEAERETRQAIALAPDNPHAYRMLGGIYIFNGEYDKAIEVLQHAIALYPAREAYSNLGVAYFNLRRFGDAVKALQNVCTDVTKSLDFDSCGNLARAYYWSPDDRAKARETYQRAVHMAEENLKINPKNGDTHILMANYYAMLGDSSSAFKSLERALKLGPGTPEYLAIAAVVHNHFGRKNDALNYLEKARFRGYSVAEIKASPEFDNLRDNARFRQVVSAR